MNINPTFIKCILYYDEILIKAVFQKDLIRLTCSASSAHTSLKKHGFIFVTGSTMIDNDEYNSLVSTIDGDGADGAN